MKTKTGYLLSILVLSIVLSCSNTNEFYTVEIVDDVRIVHNIKPLWGDEPKIELVFVKQIGGLDVTDENYLLFRPSDVTIDSKGNLYVVDTGNNRIQKYNPEGEFLASFGIKGQGPGELLDPTTIEISINGDIYVANSGNARVEVYDSQGNVKEAVKPSPYILDFVLLSSGEFVLNSSIAKAYRAETKEQVQEIFDAEPFLLEIYSTDGNLKRQIGKQRMYATLEFQLVGNFFYFGIDLDDDLYTSFQLQNRIEKYNKDGDLLLKIDRKLGYSESTKYEMQEKEVNGKIVTTRVRNMFSMGLEIDPMGRIWTTTLLNQPDPDIEKQLDQNSDFLALEVFDNEGILLTRLPYPVSWMSQLKLIYNDRLFFVDGINEMAVYEYKIVEK